MTTATAAESTPATRCMRSSPSRRLISSAVNRRPSSRLTVTAPISRPPTLTGAAAAASSCAGADGGWYRTRTPWASYRSTERNSSWARWCSVSTACWSHAPFSETTAATSPKCTAELCNRALAESSSSDVRLTLEYTVVMAVPSSATATSASTSRARRPQ